ncbi:MAG: hypothetical protein ACR5K5_04225 [Wolbachia sp.]
MLVGAAIVGGGALLTGVGAAIGASSASSKYNNILSVLVDKNKKMSKIFKQVLEAVEKKILFFN